jgi:uroporphyrinogen decarboxylase
LDSRERTFLALQHQQPDRVPVDCWISSAMREKVNRNQNIRYDQFLDQNDIDLRYIPGPHYIGPAPKTSSNSVDIDIWGVTRKLTHVHLTGEEGDYTESYKQVIQSPLQDARSVEEILEYDHWPSPEWFDYEVIEQQCLKIKDAGRVVVFMGDRLNRIAQLKPACYLRGFEQVFIDMVENPEIARALFRKISDFYMEYGRRILAAAKGHIDILCTGDDFGTQNAPLISLPMWRDFLKPGFKDFIKLGKEHGSYVMHHTCGSVFPLIPDMIECELDILQSLQPEAANMEPCFLKELYGDRLCFQGGISIQNILPHGSPEDVRRHVQEVMEAMSPGGGYIACTSHNIQADTSIRNLDALFKAYRDFGRYN